jgi:TolB-like protein/DNA-binding winged helix-turn-helix (wHTH) protein/Tfp pilus assembly protein PilF
MSLQDSAQPARVSFLDFTLDLAAERLMRGNLEIKLRPKSFQVLRHLVEHQGRVVTREELMAAVWSDVAVTDESLSKCIADIRKALGDDSQDIVRTVTRRGFLFQAAVRILEPDQVSVGPLRPGKRTFPGKRRMLGLLAAILTLLACVIAFRWPDSFFVRKPIFDAVAVLPFECLSSGGADQQYIGDGMTEALITALGESNPFRVIARTSVNRYLKTKKPIREIARELDVDAVVEGTVSQADGRVRVTANLIQVSPERHIWAHSYERSLRDVLKLQDDIAAAIAGEVRVKLTPPKRTRPRTSHPINTEAQLLYWKARYIRQNQRNPAAARMSIKFAEQSLQIDPASAAASAELAMSYARLGNMGGALQSEVRPRAKTAAQRALALDEDLGAAHVALGFVLLFCDWDWAGAERELRRALTLNPSDAEARQYLAHYFAWLGRTDEAVAEIRRARELDPFSFTVHHDVAKILYWARRYDDALAEARQANDMQPDTFPINNLIARCYIKKGLVAEAVTADLRSRATRDGLSEESQAVLRAAYARKGLQAYLRQLKEIVLPLYRSNPGGVYHLADICAVLNETDEAFQWLEKAYELRSSWMNGIKVDSSLDGLRSDPRFSSLVQRMGLPR